MFFIELIFTQPLEEIVRNHGAAHGDFLDRYYQSGNFIVSGPEVPKIGGVILAKAKDYAEIKAIIEEDPFVIHGVVDYHIIEFEPNKQQTWFNRTL